MRLDARLKKKRRKAMERWRNQRSEDWMRWWEARVWGELSGGLKILRFSGLALDPDIFPPDPPA